MSEAGATIFCMAANTPHMKECLVDLNKSQFAHNFVSLPRAVIDRASELNFKRVAIIGTKLTMTEDFYQETSANTGVEVVFPANI